MLIIKTMMEAPPLPDGRVKVCIEMEGVVDEQVLYMLKLMIDRKIPVVSMMGNDAGGELSIANHR